MGRRRTKDFDLPPRMARKGGAYYYVTTTRPRRWIALGTSKPEALVRWAEIEGRSLPVSETSLEAIWLRYEREVLPTKAPATQVDNRREAEKLLSVFGRMQIDAILPQHVRKYLDIRGQQAKVRANREKALLSHIINCARAWGYTSAPNPCAGIKGHRTPGRDRYVSDDEFRKVWDAADWPLRDAMDIALLTGQRPADVLRFALQDIRDGALWVKQGKTSKRLRIEVVGELATVIDRCRKRAATYPVACMRLVVSEDGAPMTKAMLRRRFDEARTRAKVDFQFRDLRAKAATEAAGLDHAQRLLGHRSVTMTEHYVRERAGEKVKPLR